jgi:FKBP-type peptidyl-prolyl cis-trans isomerase FkpA
MRKIIYVLTVLCAVAMVSCGKKGSAYIQKGSKSNVDSLSYAVGVDIGLGISNNMPDMKFDWDVLNESCEDALYTQIEPGKEDERMAKGIEILNDFFQTKRRDRVTAFIESLNIPDSLMGKEPIDFSGFDVFENDDERKSVSAAYGYDMGSRLREARVPLHLYWFHKGVKEAADGVATLDAHGSMMIIQEYFTVLLPMKNKRESEEWLASIEKKSGVKKTESGLLYRIDRKGDESIKPTANDRVKVDYEGRLQDGTVFDSSYARGQAAEFPLSGVIAGWTEGLQLVGKGGQITLWIPSDLGYGVYGNGGGLIGPNAALEFKVELHDVTVAGAPEAAPAEADGEKREFKQAQ